MAMSLKAEVFKKAVMSDVSNGKLISLEIKALKLKESKLLFNCNRNVIEISRS